MGLVRLRAVWLIHEVDCFQRLFQDSLKPTDTKSTGRIKVLLKRADLLLSTLRFHHNDIKPMSRRLLLKGRNVPSNGHGGVLEYLSYQSLYSRIVREQ